MTFLRYESIISKDDFKKLYIDKNKTIKELMAILKISKKKILSIIKLYGIKKPKDLFEEASKNSIKKKYGVENFSQSHLNLGIVSAFSSKSGFIKYLISHDCVGITSSELSKRTGYKLARLDVLIKKYDLVKEKYILEKAGYSMAEVEIAEYLKSIGITNIKRNVNVFKNSTQELDIYLPGYKLGIEFDGDFWHSDRFKNPYYHQLKSKEAWKNGIVLLHVFSHEWAAETSRNNFKKLISNSLQNRIERAISSEVIAEDFGKCNIRWYIDNGYKIKGYTKPDWIYWKKDNDWMTRAQASGIGDWYLKEQGYLRVYDCGNIIFEKQNKQE